MPETTFEESYLGTIDELLRFADQISVVLNTEITAATGMQADWQYWVGVTEIPEAYAKNFAPERFKRLSDLWILREQSNSILNWEADHSLTEWVKNLAQGVKPIFEKEQEVLFLTAANKQLEINHAKALKQIRATHEGQFNQFKADVLIALKATELCAIASQRHGEIALNHRVRDQRLEHLQSIIANAFKDFSDRSLSSYSDDF